MGRRGPAKKPRALRLLHGDRADRINDYEPVPSAEPLLPPEGITAEVRAVWDFTVLHLEIMGTAAASDRDALHAYCEAVVAHAKASEILAKSAVLIKGIHGALVRNPALQIQRDSARSMLRFAQEFGLTPSARTGIEVGAERGETSPFSGIG
ncbi:phage terminase small subunit P27 family [Actinophytocola sediminis]